MTLSAFAKFAKLSVSFFILLDSFIQPACAAPIFDKAGIFRYQFDLPLLPDQFKSYPSIDIVTRFDLENPPVLLDFKASVGEEKFGMDRVSGFFWEIDTQEKGHHLIIATQSGPTFVLQYNYSGHGLMMVSVMSRDFVSSSFSHDPVIDWTSSTNQRELVASRLPNNVERDTLYRLIRDTYHSPDCQNLILKALSAVVPN